MKKKVAIIGSRSFGNEGMVRDFVASLPHDTIVVSGGARGVDSWAESAAKARGMETITFLPDWDRYGKSAGFKRNHDIINAADSVVAFWDGVSKGTQHSIGLAAERGIPVEVFTYNPISDGKQESLPL